MLQHTAELKKAENQRWEMLQHAAELKMGEKKQPGKTGPLFLYRKDCVKCGERTGRSG